MRTDALLDTLAADGPPRGSWRPVRALPWALFGALLSLGVLLATLGARANLASALADPRVLYKFVLAAIVGATGAALTVRLARPEEMRRFWVPLAALLALVVAALATDLAATAPAAWMPALRGDGPWKCLTLVLALSVPPAALLFAALRRSAPSSPSRAGAAVGLVSGALATSIFALNCQNDTAIFVSVWYGLGIALTAGAGAIAGRRVLAW